MNIRRLNNDGIDSFSDFLDSFAGDAPKPYPLDLLADRNKTEEIHPSINIEKRTFGSRYAAAEYLYTLFKDSGLTGIERDRGLWAWLSLFYFDELCRPNAKGRDRLGERARWIFNPSPRRYYKHLLAGPYFVYRAHADNPERIFFLLCGPLHEISDVYKEIVERQEIITNKELVESAKRLYFDPIEKTVKKNVARDSLGGARRLVAIVNQLDCTFDLFSMTADDFLKLLPAEFNKFKPKNA